MSSRAGRAASRPSRAGVGLGLVVAATALLGIVSRGKWSDALIDSGREWIVPDALARGQLLYRDVVYWFGPFTPYFQALFLALFGSGYGSLVAAGSVAAAGCLGALFLALRKVTGRREALLWVALAIPSLVFMPNAGGPLLGMGYRIWHAAAFALLAIWAAARSGSRSRWSFLAGALAGLSGLCRTEWGLAAVAGLLLEVAAPRRDRRRLVPAAGSVLAGFLLVFGTVTAGFLLAAGPRAVLADGHLLFSRVPEETRTFLVTFSGIRAWRRGVLAAVYSAATWTAAFLLIETLAMGPERRRRRLAWLFGLLAIVALAASAGGASGAVVWSAAPAISAAALAVGLLRRERPRGAALAALGFLGLVLSYRRPFSIGDSAYVGPPLLFAFASAAGLLRLRVAAQRGRAVRRRERRALAATLVALCAVAFAARWRYYSSWNAAPLRGTGGWLTARTDVARDIEEAARTIRLRAAPGTGLVVFPEGEVLNFLTGRSNPIRHKLYLPGYLTDDNEGEILTELERARPGAVVLWLRPASEYGRGFFGADYGRRIAAWIEANYDFVPCAAPGAPPSVHPRFRCGIRRPASERHRGL